MSVFGNIVSIIHDFHDRAHAHDVSEAEKSYGTDPTGTIKNMWGIDPDVANKLQTQYTANQQATQDRHFNFMRDVLRGLPAGADPTVALDNMAPALGQQMGISPDTIGSMKTLLLNNPNALMDDKAYEQFIKDRYSSTVATPGSDVIRGGQVIDRVPTALKPVNTAPGNVTSIFDPSSGRFITGPGQVAPRVPVTPVTPDWTQPGAGGVGGGFTHAPAAAAPTDLTLPPANSGITLPPGGDVGPTSHMPLTVATLKPLFSAQESHGDYTAVNKDTGALGRYQLMPATAQSLARQSGLAWRPDMMSKDDPASRAYQDKLGDAAIQASIDAGGGNPAAVFSHYYSGSSTAYQNPRGNPKTARYVSDMMGRLQGAGGGDANYGATPYSISVAPKPSKAAVSVRAATPDEVRAAGYPEGTAAQVDANGKFLNIKTPTDKAAATAPSFEKWQGTDHDLADLRTSLVQLRDDPELARGTGMMGAVTGWLPGSHKRYLQGLVDKVNSQKMVGLVTTLQNSGANPFTRVTNYVDQTLPKTLGNFDLGQSTEDIRKNAQEAIDRVDDLRARSRQSAMRAGVLNPDNTPGNRSIGSRLPVPQQQQQTAPGFPKIGEVRRGYRFNGGNPALQSSWSPAQ